MPTIEINDAEIYYEVFGDDPHLHLRQVQVSTSLRTGSPDRAPIVLIHGSTIDRGDWDVVAPELAKHYKVFAPDCRGHGVYREHPQEWVAKVLEFLKDKG